MTGTVRFQFESTRAAWDNEAIVFATLTTACVEMTGVVASVERKWCGPNLAGAMRA